MRAAIPAAATPGGSGDALDVAGGRRPDVAIPGFSGAGVTVALLDTGVDLVHPYIRSALLRGLDVLDPGGNASARQNPTSPGRPERHGTEMAGLVAGSGGPAGLEGVAPGVALLPIRVAGWQPDTTGGVSVYGRTDQLLAGIELAVDPNEDGDAHDAARVQLVGVVEPFAAFTDGPLAAAAAGAAALDSLVVAPAGNDGPAGPAYGSVGGPGGAPAALTAGAIDTRRRSPTGHVLLLAGLRTLVSGVQPLGGVVAPSLSVSAPVVACRGPRRPSSERPVASPGCSTVTATAASAGLPSCCRGARPRPRRCARSLPPAHVPCSSTARCPAGSLGTDGPADVPILGLTALDADAVRLALRGTIPVTLDVGAAAFDENEGLGAAAPFSSEGLAFDGGPKPEVSAAGIGLATSDPGRDEDGAARYGTLSGSSAAAALTAGAAALLAQARPDLDAAGLKQALVATTRRGVRSRGGAARPLGGRRGRARRRSAGGGARRRAVRERDRQAAHDVAQRQPALARAHDRAGNGRRRRHRRRDGARGGEARPGEGAAGRGRRDGSAAAACSGRARRRAARQGHGWRDAADSVDDRGAAREAGPDPERAPLVPRLRAVGRRPGGADGRRRARRRQRRAAAALPLESLAIELYRGERTSGGSRSSATCSRGATRSGSPGGDREGSGCRRARTSCA